MHCISKHRMINDIMEKITDLSDFDKVKIIVARWLKTSIFETAYLVNYSCAVLVSTRHKWCMNGETKSLQSAICHPQWTYPEESRNCYALFVLTEEFQQPKSQKSYNSGDPDSISQYSVLHALLHMHIDLSKQQPKHIPGLTSSHRQHCMIIKIGQ